MNYHSQERIILIEVAILEANRFINKAKAAKKKLKEDDMAYITGSKETAAAKRASLDLTRALADFRKGRRDD